MVAREVKTPFGVIYPSRMQTTRGDAREPRPHKTLGHYHKQGSRKTGACVVCGEPMPSEKAK